MPPHITVWVKIVLIFLAVLFTYSTLYGCTLGSIPGFYCQLLSSLALSANKMPVVVATPVPKKSLRSIVQIIYS